MTAASAAASAAVLSSVSKNTESLLTFEQKEAFLYLFAVAFSLAALSYVCEVVAKGIICLYKKVKKKK